jgi:DnaJ-class molecular chaperone
MFRKKPPEKKFVVRYVPCVSSAKICVDCKGQGTVKMEDGKIYKCTNCKGVGYFALVWEVHVAA